MSPIQQGSATVQAAKSVFQKLDAISAIDKIVPFEHLSCCLEKDDSELYNGKCWECFVKSPGAGLQRRCLHQAFGGVRTCFKGLIRLLLVPYKAIIQSPIRSFRVLEALGCYYHLRVFPANVLAPKSLKDPKCTNRALKDGLIRA